MVEVFVVPCSNPKAQEHLHDTVIDGVTRTHYEQYTDAYVGDPASIWGVSPGADRFLGRMSVGDVLLFYLGENRYEYVARVIGREVNEPLAAYLWTEYEIGLRENNDELWPNIIYLDEVRSVDIDSREVHHEHAGHSRGHPQNFMRLTEAAVRSIESAYGSVEAFVDRHSVDVSPTAVDIEKRELDAQLDSPPELTEPQSYSEQRRKERSAVFARDVKSLYDNRCAICGSYRLSPDGLPEVEAAHIYPKSHDGKDDIRNGLALCRLHHWALDSGWLAIDDQFRILVQNCESVPGYEDFEPLEGKEIDLPDNENKRPAKLYLREHRALHGFGE